MEITFDRAEERDAETVTVLRRQIWSTTYQGIYSDELIDNYDYQYHINRDIGRIRDNTYHVYLINCGGEPVGYLYFQDSGSVHIQALYILEAYQRLGIGRMAFNLVRQYCLSNGYLSFTCNCNRYNHKAQRFYERMGGNVINEDFGHSDRRDDQITYSFTV